MAFYVKLNSTNFLSSRMSERAKEMRLVGPRPGLFHQIELTEVREKLDVYRVRPGITGLSQINKIDMSPPELLDKTDLEMIQTMSVENYPEYILHTLAGKGSVDRVH